MEDKRREPWHRVTSDQREGRRTRSPISGARHARVSLLSSHDAPGDAAVSHPQEKNARPRLSRSCPVTYILAVDVQSSTGPQLLPRRLTERKAQPRSPLTILSFGPFCPSPLTYSTLSSIPLRLISSVSLLLLTFIFPAPTAFCNVLLASEAPQGKSRSPLVSALSSVATHTLALLLHLLYVPDGEAALPRRPRWHKAE